MKIETRQEEALILGAETVTMGLNNLDPSIFVQMLIRLYQFPIEATVREALSNSWDSIVEAGVDSVPLVGLVDDKFFVQDFGTGMSPEFMLSTTKGFSTIGYSTKRETNNQLGYWGFGKVVSLSYTKDQFWIHTVWNRIAYEYLVVLDGNTIKVIPLSQQETTEPQGTRISVQLKNDWQEKSKWKESIRQQCAYFNGTKIQLEEEILEVKTTKIKNTITSNIYTDETHLVLGCVYYTIPWEHFQEWSFIRDLNVGIYVGLDEGITPVPSREAWEYNEVSKQIIVSRFKELTESIWFECDTYLKDLSTQKEIHRLKFFSRNDIPISFPTISYKTYKQICTLLGKDIVKIEVYPEIESNVYTVWRTIVNGFDGVHTNHKRIYKESWTKLNEEYCGKQVSRNKNRIEFFYSVFPDYTGIEDSERTIHRRKRHDEIRDELVKQFIEEFTIPFDQAGFEEWKKNRKKEKKETKQGVSYYRESFTSVTNCVREKGDIDLNNCLYIFSVDSDETAKKYWYPVSRLHKSIILYKDKSGMSASLDEMKPSPFLKRLCSEALRAKVWNILGDKTKNKSILKLIQEVNPLLHQYLVELDLKESPFKEEHQALVEVGELLGCFDKNEMKVKYVKHHLNKLLFIKYLGRQKYTWEDVVFSDEELHLIKRHYILERLAEKKESVIEVPTNQLTLELC